jgi:serine/threonine protein phosphatase 1
MEQLFVVGDLHGRLDMLELLLKKWKSDSQRLVFIGDYIDRGPDSYGVIHRVQQLQADYGAKAILGNHEQMFLNWLDDPEEDWFLKWKADQSILNDSDCEGAHGSNSINFYENGGDKTIDSFYNGYYAYKHKPSVLASYIKKMFNYELQFLRELPFYFEWRDYICVHAGVDFEQNHWKTTSEHDFLWIREPFHQGVNNTDKTIIFGHQRTKFLNQDRTSGVWLSPCKTKIGIDGGAAYADLLHGLVLGDIDIYAYSVDQSGKTNKELICK